MQRKRDIPLFFLLLFAIVFATRLCHRSILWADEDYHLAAAIQVLYGKVPYRDIWYDKPPLNLGFYLLFGARVGWALRLAGAVFITAASALAFRFASRLWTRREGFLAALLLAFYLVFYLPDSTIPLEPDTLMIAPHLGAVYLAWRRRPLAAGLACGVAFLLNAKGLFVLLVCAIFFMPGLTAPSILPIASLLAGFLLPNALVLGSLAWLGAFGEYIQQVWKWGFLYFGIPAADAARKGLGLAVHWAGFHAALLIGAALYWWKSRTRQALDLALWAAVSLVGAGLGWRFTPRYFNQLLPALVIPAARGIALAWEAHGAGFGAVGFRWIAVRAALLVSLVVPMIRFGPRYVELGRDELAGSPHHWRDIAMDRDSQEAAGIVNGLARSGDSIFVWGYRPNVVAYTRLPIASRFWDSQPLTGVPADRHLASAQPILAGERALANRMDLANSTPEFLVDGLSLLNPRLDIRNYPDLRPWLSHYCPVGRTGLTLIYRRCEGASSQ